ncbi:MAG TPA: 2,3-bisphosphoglycerate-independent phosphoglycerate mutase [Gemmatimonadota bacterium]|nr:2,3-bisphosphoglycerate-independent phosphoglycerate mutase [Gemmatimonadota bacterium]
MEPRDLAELSQPSDAKVLLLVMDGLGGLPAEPAGRTELETARTPNLDRLLREGGGGLHDPVSPGITPGSGPGHLGLFGYDPLEYRIGRGVLEALGIDFDLRPGDVAARGNLATVDDDGVITDRRAGRISSEAAAPLCERLDGLEVEGAEAIVRPVKEHRFLLVLRFSERLEADLEDTDPGREGARPLDPEPRTDASRRVAGVVRSWLEKAREELAGESPANAVLLRGFATRPHWPTFPEVTGMRAFAAAAYPMYRGVARLVGMEATTVEDGTGPLASALEEHFDAHDFFFLHVKGTDKAGEDGDFDRKVSIIEDVDSAIPRLLEAGPGVVLVTGDHSTPARLERHSSHPVPFLIWGGAGRTERAQEFGETGCAGGAYGRVRSCHLLPLTLARAGRLAKFGA